MSYLIGVDAGGTKTTFSAYSLDGELIQTFRLGAGNIALNEVATQKILTQGITSILELLGENCLQITLGIAGIETSGLTSQVKKAIKQIMPEKCNIQVMSDARLALVTKLKGKDGGLIISGTGSVAYGLKDGKFYRAGGFGHLIGDEGSGFSIGLACYKQLANELDTKTHLSTFSKQFLAFLQEKNPYLAINHLYQLTKAEIAAAAIFVMNYDDQNKIKQRILTQTISELAMLVWRLMDKMKIKHMPLAIAGSVLEKNEMVYQLFCEKIAKYVDSFIVSDEINTKAVYYLYNKLQL